MQRGAITILQPDSFAANDISHCVRSSDMEGELERHTLAETTLGKLTVGSHSFPLLS